ncbi:MAG: GrpB family protein [Acidobacteria bacterium]|nr:GrpB family protein [Acidobacteriota bacterium]
MAEPIELGDYDPKWPEIFRNEAEKIRSALRESAVIVEHVGSSSIPDPPVKPIVDMVLVGLTLGMKGRTCPWRNPITRSVSVCRCC